MEGAGWARDAPLSWSPWRQAVTEGDGSMLLARGAAHRLPLIQRRLRPSQLWPWCCLITGQGYSGGFGGGVAEDLSSAYIIYPLTSADERKGQLSIPESRLAQSLAILLFLVGLEQWARIHILYTDTRTHAWLLLWGPNLKYISMQNPIFTNP